MRFSALFRHKGAINLLPKDSFESSWAGRVLSWALAFGKWTVIVTQLVVIGAFLFRFGYDRKLTDLRRSLEEEAGIKAKKWQSLGYFYSSDGTITEKAYMFLAMGISKVKRNLDVNERIEIVRVKFSKALEMVLNGKITDSYAVVPLMKTSYFLKEKSK